MKDKSREPDAAFSDCGFEIREFEVPNPEVILNRSSVPSATATTVCGDGWRWTIFRSEFRSNFHQLPRP
jgi:hypothetical protein